MLLDPSMVLLQPIIEILVGPMLNVAAHYLAYCSWIGRMAVRRHLIGNMANDINRLLEKLLGRLHVPLLAQPRINQIAIPIDGPVQITPLPMHLHVRFINIPGGPCLSTSPGS